MGVPLDPHVWLPAPGQGAIAVECRADDTELRDLLAAINHAPSFAAVTAERALLWALGGNCHSPIAVLTEHVGGQLVMTALLLSPDGAEEVRSETTFAPGDLGVPHALAAELLDRAGSDIRVHFDPPEQL